MLVFTFSTRPGLVALLLGSIAAGPSPRSQVQDSEESVRSLLVAGFEAYKERRLKDAEPLLQRVRVLAEEVRDAPAQARASAMLGDIRFEWGDYRGALEHLEHARSEIANVPEPWLVLLVLDDAGIAYSRVGRPEDAETAHRHYIEAAIALGRDPSAGYAGIARVHEERGEDEQAVEMFDKALAVALELGTPRSVAYIGFRYGEFLERHGRPYDALRRYELALDVGDTGVQPELLGNLGKLYLSAGDYGKARDVLSDLLAGTELDRSDPVCLRSRTLLGRIRRLTGSPAESLRILEQVLEDCAESQVHDRAQALAEITTTLGDLDRRGDQASRLGEALDLAARNRGSPEILVQALQHVVGFLIDDGDNARCRLLLSRARELAVREGLEADLVQIEANLGWLDYLEGDFASAIERSRRALETLWQSGSEGAVLEALDTVARASFATSDLERAGRALAQAEGVLERPNLGGLTPDEVSGWRSRHAKWRATAQEYVRRRLEIAQADSADRWVAEGLRQSDLWKQRGVQRAARRRAGLAGTSPERSASLLRTNPEPRAALDLARIRATVLPPNAALIEYAVGYGDLIAYVLTHDDLVRVELGPMAGFESDLAEFVAGISDPRALADVRSLSHYGRRLHDAVVAPVIQTLRDGVDHLVIVPVDSLSTLPFGALVSRAPDAPRSFAELAFLVDRYVVSYGPSVSVLEVTSGRTGRSPGERALILVDPLYDASVRARLEGTREEGLHLAQILAEEVEDKAALGDLRLERTGELPTGSFDLYLGAHAHSGRLRGDLTRFSLLYVGAHGVVNLDRPYETGISLTDRSDRADTVTVSDILRLELDAELTVLSACSSAGGALREGEGLQSMARAFAIAGSTGVVATLWPINDQQAPQAMKVFLEALLLDNERPAQALHRAALHVRRSSEVRGLGVEGPGEPATVTLSHPYCWAAFIYSGPVK